MHACACIHVYVLALWAKAGSGHEFFLLVPPMSYTTVCVYIYMSCSLLNSVSSVFRLNQL